MIIDVRRCIEYLRQEIGKDDRFFMGCAANAAHIERFYPTHPLLKQVPHEVPEGEFVFWGSAMGTLLATLEELNDPDDLSDLMRILDIADSIAATAYWLGETERIRDEFQLVLDALRAHASLFSEVAEETRQMLEMAEPDQDDLSGEIWKIIAAADKTADALEQELSGSLI